METSTILPRNYGVLVADDEPGVRDVLDVGMRQAGFKVWLAPDGQEALNLYRRHRKAIDVVLLDVCMPVLNGPQTLVAIQELTPHIPCCFMSGFLGDYTTDDLHALGAAKVLPKPFHLADVAHAILVLARQAGSSLYRPMAGSAIRGAGRNG